jgi:hypothetical protein
MAIPSGLHNDWVWPFSLIPRKATAIEGPPPTDVTYSPNFDKAHHNPDVPNEGAWALSKHPEYGVSYAEVKDGVLFAAGTFRYDYSDHYYEIGRFTNKKLS